MIPNEQREIIWNASTMSYFDPHINQYKLEVQMITHLQNLVNQLPNAFINTKRVTSHIAWVQMLQHGLMSLKDS